MKGVRDYWIIYYLVYFVSVIVLLALNWRNFTADNYVYLLAAIGGAAISIALFVAVVTEGIGYMVLLIPRRIKQLKDEGRQEGHQEGRQEGHQESHQEWMAWYERQQAALRDGRPFTEPPPAGPQAKNGK
jgi:hypothetical protein